MADKQHGPRTISLYSRTAGEILSRTDLTLYHHNGNSVQSDHRSNQPATSNLSSASLPEQLIPLGSLGEILTYHNDGESNKDRGTPDTEDRPDLHGDTINSLDLAAALDEDDSHQQKGLSLDQVSEYETKKDMYCNTCHVYFSSREEQVEHYRLDWHRYNLKRKLKGLPRVDQEEFEKVAGDLSSISGSESDSTLSGKETEEEALTNTDLTSVESHAADELSHSPFVYFTTRDEPSAHLYAVYRSVLTGMKRGGVSLEAIKNMKKEQVWIVLMRSGGHFAGTVFKGSSVVAHKTFHRYTVRAKRGTAQSVRDGQSGGHQPKSAGASLRRYNEATLAQEIQELIASWDTHVRGATSIFIRTPKYSKGVFVGEGKAPFSKDDPRLRSIPFVTRRPTLKEVQRVHSKLACIYRLPPSESTDKGRSKPRKHSPKGKRSHISTDSSLLISEQNIGSSLDSEIVDREQVKEEIAGVNRERVNEEIVDQLTTEPRDGSTGNGRVNKKRKKTKKGTNESQEDIPDTIQSLLKTCKQTDDNEDILSSLAEQLQAMGLASLDGQPSTHSSTPVCESEPVTFGYPSTLDTVINISADFGTDHQIKSGLPVNDSTKTVESLPTPTDHAASVPMAMTPQGTLNALWNGSTILHTAAATGCARQVTLLLLFGADPSIKNQLGRTPYSVSKDRIVRDAFRRFMALHPAAYDYNLAQIPSPLTEDMEKERKEKTNEKKKAQKKARKQRERESKSTREEASVSMSREKKVSELSGREKRALAAEKRLANQLPASTAVIKAGKCSFCQNSLAGVVPFERLAYKYCTMTCLKEHRDKID